jgi:hypothetical protein
MRNEGRREGVECSLLVSDRGNRGLFDVWSSPLLKIACYWPILSENLYTRTACSNGKIISIATVRYHYLIIAFLLNPLVLHCTLPLNAQIHVRNDETKNKISREKMPVCIINFIECRHRSIVTKIVNKKWEWWIERKRTDIRIRYHSDKNKMYMPIFLFV